MHPEFYSFKNKEEMLIIIYCDDERISQDAAKLFVDRGTDNIFLLTGGLIEFATDYPSFVEGDLRQMRETNRLRSANSKARTCEYYEY